MTFQELRDAPGRRLVLFFGAQCAPCARLKPKLDEIASWHGVELHHIDVATELPVARELQLRGVPAALSVGDGMVTPAFTGDLRPEQIVRQLQEVGLIRA